MERMGTDMKIAEIVSEKPLIMKMKENYRYFGGLSLLYGLIFAFCLYRNTAGITFPLCVAATIGFALLFMKKINYKMQKHSVPYIVGMVLLGVSTALTDSWFLHFFNMAGIILLFFVFMIHQFYNDYRWNFPAYLKRIFILLWTVVECLPYPYRHGTKTFGMSKDDKERNTLLAIVIGVLVALGILSVTLPLLLKSDAMFAKIFGDLLRYINFSTIFGIAFMIVLGFTLSYAFFSALCKYNFPEGRDRKLKYYNPVIGITFTGIVTSIYLMYCLIQIMYLFIGISAGLPDSMTYSEYARGGFWELLFVSFINFIMVLLCMYIFSENIVLKIVLTIVSGCTFIMIASAAYRILLYVKVYHLTFLRILVIWFLIVLTLIMSGVIISIYKKKFPLFQYIMAVVGALYIVLSFSRPDAIVAKYNIAHTEDMTREGLHYYMYQLSQDAAPEIAKVDVDKLQRKGEYGYTKEHTKWNVYNYFLNISKENEGLYFRKANYSRIRAKLAADKWLEEHKDYAQYEYY